MGKMLRVLLAVIVIVGVSVWAIDLVRQRSYSGSNLSFKVGGGSVVITNRSDEPALVRMRTIGRAALFRVHSAELDLTKSATRQGSGRNSHYSLSFEIPPGQAEVEVTRGTDVYFIADSNQHLEAIVKPQGRSGGRSVLTFAGLVILGALYFISRTFEHRWLEALRGRLPARSEGLKEAT